MASALIGLGIAIQMATVALPGVKTTIANVYDISTTPYAKFSDVDVSTYDQGNSFRQFIPGLADPGEFTFMMNYVPGSATDIFLRSIQGTNQIVTVSMPNGATLSFQGAILEYGPDKMPVDNKLTAHCRCKVSGAVTTAAASAPAVVVQPSIAGTTLVRGGTLTADVGVWTPSGTSYTYQWLKNGVNIAGAIANSYVTLIGDVGGAITVTVTAINSTGSTAATSLPTGNIT